MSNILSPEQAFRRVYLAGKIGKNDWRHDIFPSLREAEHLDSRWRRDVEIPSFTYVGPFFISCDHGCSHGEGQHGRGIEPAGCLETMSEAKTRSRAQVAAECLKWINKAGFVFCWIEDLTAFGTLFELGYAHAIGKPIFVGLKRNVKEPGLSRELWLSLVHAHKCVETDDHLVAWSEFRAWIGHRRKVAQSRRQKEPMTASQKKYLEDLIARIPGLSVIDPEGFADLDKSTAGMILLCMTTGGDVSLEFPSLFGVDQRPEQSGPQDGSDDP